MVDDHDDDPALAWALVRYRLIADADAAPRGARTALLQLAASKEVTWPDGRAVQVTVHTLQRWLARFQRGGLPPSSASRARTRVAFGRSPTRLSSA
jgi:hypothetical protein